MRRIVVVLVVAASCSLVPGSAMAHTTLWTDVVSGNSLTPNATIGQATWRYHKMNRGERIGLVSDMRRRHIATRICPKDRGYVAVNGRTQYAAYSSDCPVAWYHGKPEYQPTLIFARKHRPSRWHALTWGSSLFTGGNYYGAPKRVVKTLFSKLGAGWEVPEAIASSASARVVMGCSTLGSAGRHLTSLKAHPRNCGIAALEGTSSGLRNVRWEDWGAARALGVGQAMDGLGFAHPAHFTAFARKHRDGVTFYSRLHVVSKSVRVPTGGCKGCAPYTREPGIKKTVNVTPWGL